MAGTVFAKLRKCSSLSRRAKSACPFSVIIARTTADGPLRSSQTLQCAAKGIRRGENNVCPNDSDLSSPLATAQRGPGPSLHLREEKVRSSSCYVSPLH